MHEPISGKIIQSEIRQQLTESAEVKILMASGYSKPVQEAVELLLSAVHAGSRILLCGNGGSAADAQHIAAELVSRLRAERKALPALALTTNTSTFSAIANDYDFSKVFVRQVEAFGSPGDVLIGISTSGNSENVVNAIQYAKENGLKTIGLTGSSGGKLSGLADVAVIVPSDSVQRIQEVHITIGHIWCDIIEQSILPVTDRSLCECED